VLMVQRNMRTIQTERPLGDTWVNRWDDSVCVVPEFGRAGRNTKKNNNFFLNLCLSIQASQGRQWRLLEENDMTRWQLRASTLDNKTAMQPL